MSKHVSDIRVLIPGTSAAMTRICTVHLSCTDIWRSWTIIYRDIPILDILGIWRHILFGKVYDGIYSVQKFGKSIWPHILGIWPHMTGHGIWRYIPSICGHMTVYVRLSGFQMCRMILHDHKIIWAKICCCNSCTKLQRNMPHPWFPRFPFILIPKKMIVLISLNRCGMVGLRRSSSWPRRA